MGTLSTLGMYGRFAAGLPGYLRREITLDDARAAIERGLARRTENFLSILDRAIASNPASPT